ncbi:MAG: YihY/virulence factor BrkB family protein [Haloarculaceae archaeon]
MRFDRTRTETVLRAILHEVKAEKLTFLAGSIAYHAFISILPLLLLMLAVLERTRSPGLRESLLGIMEAVLTRQASGVLQQGLADANASVSVLGAVFLVWGALRIFRGLDTAFSDIYETEAENTFLDQIGDGLLLLVTVALAIVAVSLIRSVVTFTADGILVEALQTIVTAGGLFVVLYPMYYIFPDADVSLVEIVPGTAFAAASLTVAHVLFTTFKTGGTGGNLIASILILLTWLYITGLIVLLGVAINAVLSNRSKDVDIAPVVGGVARASGRDDVTVDGAQLLADLGSLVATFDETGADVTVLVDGHRVTVPRPESAVVEQSSTVFSSVDSVELRLTWWPDTGE